MNNSFTQHFEGELRAIRTAWEKAGISRFARKDRLTEVESTVCLGNQEAVSLLPTLLEMETNAFYSLMLMDAEKKAKASGISIDSFGYTATLKEQTRMVYVAMSECFITERSKIKDGSTKEICKSWLELINRWIESGKMLDDSSDISKIGELIGSRHVRSILSIPMLTSLTIIDCAV